MVEEKGVCDAYIGWGYVELHGEEERRAEEEEEKRGAWTGKRKIMM